MTNECLTEFNERSTVVITATFTDEDGDPVTPDSATYRIDDEAARTNIQPATIIGSLDSSVELVVTDEQNAILKPRSKSELRTVTVEWDYATDKHGTAQFKYRLLNLYGVVDVPSASMSPSASASPSV
jgi:hypothetical protein